MADFGDTSEELQLKLEQYEQQLQAVDAAIALHPNETPLIKLQADLKEIIVLTKDLLEFKRQNETNFEELQSQKIGDVVHTGDASSVFVNNTAAGSSGSNVASNYISSQADLRALKLNALIGRTCQAPFEAKPYLGEILKISWSKQLGEYALVEFLGWKNRSEIPLNQIKLLQPPPASVCVPGAKLQAVYSEDGKWYDCVIDEKTEKGYRVTFTDYGNSEEIKADHVRFPLERSEENLKRKIKEIVTPAGYRIPSYLIIKPADSEHQKLLKRRKVVNLKKQQRTMQQTDEANDRANSWRKFNNKAKSKKVSGFLTGRAHESIFKSSDTVIEPPVKGAKNQVGVFIPRRKHDYYSTEET